MLAPVLRPLCENCLKPFERFTSFQTKCRRKACINSDLSRLYKAERAAVKAAKEAAKLEKLTTKARRDAIQPLSYWADQAQAAFNAWIRWRDRALPCVSCGRFHQGKVNAGHYLSRGARPELRYVETNCHLQCEPCNTNLSGNVALYRIELIRRIGQAEVDRLEGHHEPRRYRAEDLRAIRDTYRARLRAEQKEAA